MLLVTRSPIDTLPITPCFWIARRHDVPVRGMSSLSAAAEPIAIRVAWEPHVQRPMTASDPCRPRALRTPLECTTLRSRSKPREGLMNKLIVPAVIVATGLAVGAAWSQAPQQGPRFQPTPYFQMPLEKDASRVVRLQSVVIPAGAG